jgi:hypothetical protein
MTNQRTLITLLAAGAAFSFAVKVSAASVEKANDTDNLNLGSSWIGGTPPTSSDIAVWDGTVAAGITNAEAPPPELSYVRNERRSQWPVRPAAEHNPDDTINQLDAGGIQFI